MSWQAGIRCTPKTSGPTSVPEVQFADGIIARLRSRDGRAFDEQGYIFVISAIEYLQQQFDVRRHVSGGELSWAVRDLAFDKFGLMAQTVLREWGIRSTADIGRMVYSLVEIGLLSTQPGDREEDFHGVYDFEDAFGEYTWMIDRVGQGAGPGSL